MKKIGRRKEHNLLECKETLEEIKNQILCHPLTTRKIFDLWNRVAKEKGITRCSYLSDKLSRRLKKLISIFGLEQWHAFFDEISENEFLQEANWFNLSWISEPENFVKVLDGVYKRTDRKKHLPVNAIGDSKSVNNMLDAWKSKRRKELGL